MLLGVETGRGPVLLTSSWMASMVSCAGCGYPLWLQQVHLGVRDRWLWQTLLFATAATVIAATGTAMPMAVRRRMMSALVCHVSFSGWASARWKSRIAKQPSSSLAFDHSTNEKSGLASEQQKRRFGVESKSFVQHSRCVGECHKRSPSCISMQCPPMTWLSLR